jgi:membrane-bound lytic murein transglycosylase A
MDKYLWHNPRTVFFAERTGGPYGSLNVPVTPRATIATDKSVYPRALPALAAMRGLPRSGARDVWWPSDCLVLDQDTGGAIRAAGRCDLYMGVGERAGHAAGYVLRDGELFYLAVKEEFVTEYVRPAAAAQPSAAFSEQRP